MGSTLRQTALMGILLGSTCFVMYTSCGDGEDFNFYKPIAEPIALNSDDRAARLEQAKVLIDNKKYSEAVDLLEDMLDDEVLDSNETRLLYAAALVGVAKLDVWSIISTVLDDRTEGSKGSGLDDFFETFGESVLGSGEERLAKIAALNKALNALQTAPSPSHKKVANTACLFAGMLAVPTLTDAQASLETALASLDSIKSATSGDGSECPDLTNFDTATASLQTASTSFTLVLGSVQNCGFLDLSEAAQSMNSIETQLAAMTETADLGCQELPSCPSGAPDCQSLFPVCIQEAMDINQSNPAVANDGNIAACEIVLHCTDPVACFGE